MPSSEWPDEKVKRAVAEALAPLLGTDHAGLIVCVDAALTATAKASPVIPAPKCETCGGLGRDDANARWVSTDIACPDCHGTGVAAVIPARGIHFDSDEVHALRLAVTHPAVLAAFGSHSLQSAKKKLHAAAMTGAGTAAEPAAEVIPVAVLREWIAQQRTEQGHRTWRYDEALDAVAVLLDEHTRKEPTQA